jgi:hypothetical protein
LSSASLLSHNPHQQIFAEKPLQATSQTGVVMPRFAAVLLTLPLLFASSAFAQQPRLPSGITQGGSQGTGVNDAPVTSGDDAQKKQQAALNQQREAEIRRDTERMLELTQELNAYLQKSNQNVVSVDAIKKAEQIEKLARSVKSKMKQIY